MKKLFFLTLAVFGLMFSTANAMAIMDGTATTTVAATTIEATNESTTTAIDTGPADLLLVNKATLNEENRLFLASTKEVFSQVDLNNFTIAGNETDVLRPDEKGLANNGDYVLKMLVLSSCENFGQLTKEKVVAADKTDKCILTSAERIFGENNAAGRENTMLTESAATLVVATLDGALRAKIPKAAPSNREGIFEH